MFTAEYEPPDGFQVHFFLHLILHSSLFLGPLASGMQACTHAILDVWILTCLYHRPFVPFPQSYVYWAES